MACNHYVMALRSAYARGQGSFDAGAVVSVHNDSFKAQTKAQRLNTQGGHGVTDRAFAAISSDETLTKGECYPEVLAQYFQDKYEADAIHAMKGVLDPHWRGSPPVTTEMTGWALADLKLTLAELRTRYQDRAQAELDAARDKHAENAERAARARAVSNELVTERSEFTYTFPAVAGVQAGRAYYAAQVPYGALVKLFTFDSADAVPAHLRAQRVLNERRAEDIGDYVTENPTNYVLPAITASVSAEMWFEALSVAGAAGRVGLLHIPMDATLLINDGQHRRRGIEHAIEKQPALRDETITVTIYFDQGLERSQQMFADINGKQVKPSSAINALYDRRDPFNAWALSVMGILPGVGTLVDVENSTVPAKSYKLWSLVSFKKFLSVLTGVNAKNIADIEPKRIAEIDTFLVSFFEQCSAHIPKWAAMIDRDISAVEVREQYVIGHAVWLEALATFARRALFTGYLMDHGRTEEGVIRPDLAVWEQMAALSKIDPRRASLMWDNRCVVLGKMQKTTDGVKGTAAKLLTLANVWLPPDLATLDKRLQEQFGPAPRAA